MARKPRKGRSGSAFSALRHITKLATYLHTAQASPTGAPGPDTGQTALPSDIEQAAIEQAAAWFLNRDKLGLVRQWPHDGTYEQFSQLDLLPKVKAVLKKYERWLL